MTRTDSAATTTLPPPLLLMLGAVVTAGLTGLAHSLSTALAAGEELAELTDAAGLQRLPEGPELLVVAAADRSRLSRTLREFAEGGSPANAVPCRGQVGPQAVWCFGGHGGQWPGMGRELLLSAPVFRDTIDEIDALVSAEAGFGVRRILEEADAAQYERIDRIQPVTFAYQVALARWLLAAGVRPAAVVGHSVGEVAAAHISGALPLPDAVRVICLRSRLLARSSGGRGAMVSVGLSAPEVEMRTGPAGGRLSVAVYASPAETVVTGDADRVDRLIAELEPAGVRCRRIRIDAASHSHLVDDVLEELSAGAAGLRVGKPDIPWVSTVVPGPDGALADAAYWVRNLRGPVRLLQAVTELALDGRRLFLEIGPHGLLTSSIRDTLVGLGIRDARLVATCRRQTSERLSLLKTIGTLHASGVEVNMSAAASLGRTYCVQAPMDLDREG
ncbi:acyltransferase domain-containing protein [Streptomyces sp. NPDC019531]|uniref:acyltransferase domain-containing protein n=1 Tax=Streptomyces sp. NPDC019531 TaxID=3365062 RepID=UPI00384EE42C